MEDRVELTPGMDVYGAEGDKIGSIDELFSNYIRVSKGFFFPKDYYIPTSVIQGVDADNRVYLTLGKDEALHQGWDAIPAFDKDAQTGGYSAEDSTSAGWSDSEAIASGFMAETETAVGDAGTTGVPEERARIAEANATGSTSPAGTGNAFQDKVIESPVAGEVVVDREAAQRDEQIGGAVRRGPIPVDDATRDH